MLSQWLLPERKCATCATHPALKLKYGCEKDLHTPLQMDNELIRRCPMRPYLENTQWFDEIFTAHAWHMKGYLPDPGTWADQSEVFLVAMGVIEKATSDAKDVLAAQPQATMTGPAGGTGGL